MEKDRAEVTKENGQYYFRINYEIDREDNSFLKNAELIDIDKFDFNSQQYKDAVADSLRRQDVSDAMKHSTTDEQISNTFCDI